MALAEIAGMDEREFQSLALDRMLEVDGDRWAYETLVALIARQNGKTGVAKIRILAGLFLFDDGLILHTAADRALPRATFEDIADTIETNRTLSARVRRIRVANGSEEIALKDGNRYRILAPKQEAFRGWSAGLLVFDEAREQRDDALYSAALYTQRAVRNPQRLIVSNAGDPDSVILRRLVDRGRAAAADPASDRRICYLEWSTPDEFDIDDPIGWTYANPELGRSLSESAILEELISDTATRFETEALCRWVQTAGQYAVPIDAWLRCGDPDLETLEPDPAVPCFMAIDIDPGRTDAALVLGYNDPDGNLVAVVADSWTDPTGIDEQAIATAVEEWSDLWRPETVAYDPYTTGGVAERLSMVVPMRKIHGVEWVSACLTLWDVVANENIRHPSDPYLDDQIHAAGRKDVGDGSFRIARLESSIAIPAVVSLARVAQLAIDRRIEAAIL